MRDSHWTPRTRFVAALHGDMPDRVPFVIWNNKLPGEPMNTALFDAGACVIVKSALYRVVLDGVATHTESWVGMDGYRRQRTTYHTPAGRLEAVEAFRPGTTWLEAPLFREPSDYDALLALIQSRRFVPCYAQYESDDAAYGDHGTGRPGTESTPMHEIIYRLLGVENFAVEWHERRDHVLMLFDALMETRRRILPIVAGSPALYAIIEANISPDIVGIERFKKYYLPAVEEACDVLHAAGKLAGAHLDGNNRLLAPLVAQTSLDFIESFTPPPDCDLPVAEARQLWRGKALYCNFPSSVHLSGPDAVCRRAQELLAEAAPGAGFILGVLEDVPRVDALPALAAAVAQGGRTPIGTGT